LEEAIRAPQAVFCHSWMSDEIADTSGPSIEVLSYFPSIMLINASSHLSFNPFSLAHLPSAGFMLPEG
jgi:hypothetical protein